MPSSTSPPRVALFVVCLLAFAAVFAGQKSGVLSAPRFPAKTLDGKTFTNESVTGKVVQLEFCTISKEHYEPGALT